MIKAPFNFVPLSSDIFYPSWAKQISQDIPFSNGVSGTIELTITARTPIFIRNGYVGDKKDNSFCHTSDGTFFIPATTVKSCIRSVLEIMSFGKLKPVPKQIKKYKNPPATLEANRQRESATKQHVKQGYMDLAECMFGMSADNNGIRGRVQFTNFMCTNPVDMPADKKKMIYILSTPNPACLPMYIQSDGKRYFDYDSHTPVEECLNGWKRYVLKQRANLRGKDHESRMTTTIQPLSFGSTFKGKMHFHNLLPQELGALLCAITWNNENGCFHQMGQAKPYGYGRVTITIDKDTQSKAPDYIRNYREMMKQWLTSIHEEDTIWRNTYSIHELFTLAKYQAAGNDNRFDYMRGDAIKSAKKTHDSLPLLTEILESN